MDFKFAPTIEDTRQFMDAVSPHFEAQDWMPCAKGGCCTGDAWCCKHAMFSSITWIEMELIWEDIKTWPVEDRQALLTLAKEQTEKIIQQDPELFSQVEEREVQTKDPIKAVTNALKAADCACPLLGKDNLCRVYANRPLICRGYGTSVHVSKRTVPENSGLDDTEIFVIGCEKTHEAVVEKQKENGDVNLMNYPKTESDLYQLAAPSFKLYRSPLVLKPIQFWILDLADEAGDLTNPYDVFDNIRKMIDTGVLQQFGSREVSDSNS